MRYGKGGTFTSTLQGLFFSEHLSRQLFQVPSIQDNCPQSCPDRCLPQKDGGTPNRCLNRCSERGESHYDCLYIAMYTPLRVELAVLQGALSPAISIYDAVLQWYFQTWLSDARNRLPLVQISLQNITRF